MSTSFKIIFLNFISFFLNENKDRLYPYPHPVKNCPGLLWQENSNNSPPAVSDKAEPSGGVVHDWFLAVTFDDQL